MPQPMPMPKPAPDPRRKTGLNTYGLDFGYGEPGGGDGGGGTGDPDPLPLDKYVASIVGEFSAGPLAQTKLGRALTEGLDEKIGRYLSREFLLSQIANVFWSTLFDLSKSEPVNPSEAPLTLPFIVRCGQGENSRFDLVAFGDPKREPDVRQFGDYVLQRVPQFSKCLERIVTQGITGDLRQVETMPVEEAYLRFALGWLSDWKEHFEELAIDYVKTQWPCQIILPMPKIRPHVWVPDPAVPVMNTPTGQPSTAGIVAVNSKGQGGVTVAGHGIAPSGGSGGGGVLVAGNWANVISFDSVSDSAFVEMPDTVPFPIKPFTSRLQSVGPGPNQTLSFSGLASPTGSARVLGSPLTLSLNHPAIQRHVYTELATLPSDSGCACFDPNNNLVGFCFGGSGTDSAATFSLWIWADSVFQAHGLH